MADFPLSTRKSHKIKPYCVVRKGGVAYRRMSVAGKPRLHDGGDQPADQGVLGLLIIPSDPRLTGVGVVVGVTVRRDQHARTGHLAGQPVPEIGQQRRIQALVIQAKPAGGPTINSPLRDGRSRGCCNRRKTTTAGKRAAAITDAPMLGQAVLTAGYGGRFRMRRSASDSG
jgi:hypothetical protein